MPKIVFNITFNTMLFFYRMSLLCALPFYSFCQEVLVQDVVNGGVTGGGFSSGEGFGTGTIELYIEDNSTIKEAFLFIYSFRNPLKTSYIINNFEICTDSLVLISEVEFNNPSWIHASPVRLYYQSIKHVINPDNATFNVSIPSQINSSINEGFWAMYIYVVYENNSLPPVNYSVICNAQNLIGNEIYTISSLNPINNSNPVGFSLFTDRHTQSNLDISIVTFNGNQLGEIYTSDAVNQFYASSGVKGHFYYQNNTFYGLDDDIANNSMNESDGIANVSDFISNYSTNVNFSLEHIRYPNQPPAATNVNLAYFLTYTTPCQPFQTSLLSSDTTTCANSPLQLGASGGINYEWLPQTNLSCYDCPNPVFLGDSTINYTVRIWSSDGCSKVLPVRVRVLPQPSFESIDVTESVCGFSTGIIAGTSTGLSLPHTYQLNDGVPQNNFSFSNLTAGEYIITVTNSDGCSIDSTVQINEINNVQAAFTVNPNSGAAPLQVQTQNNSQNASQYEWFWEDQSSTLTNPSITLDTAGVYTLTLIAGNGAAQCNDTASVMILVREPFEVFAYTFVTNEANVYQIYLSGVSEYKYDLYTLDGKLVYQKRAAIENAGLVDLWAISGVASGMYVFRVRVKAESGGEDEIKGKLVVVR